LRFVTSNLIYLQMKLLKLFYNSINIVTIIFFIISIYLIQQKDDFAIFLGYISIVWWSLIISINIYNNHKIQ
jgi:hypothetical protein